ncbi:MAG: YgiQ family radical SAM protein [Bacteroidaceae bacterium]|nr:YgiQ family radical SAM protein [Bacteroidaceae bacterium]
MTTTQPQLTDFLPTTRREMQLRGWEQADVILLSADAYVDHPSFGAAVIGRLLEAEGLRVAIIPQPDWHGDFRDFKKLGRPRLWFGVAPGCMDSMVNKYTAARRLRSEDAYSPDGRHDLRPEYPTIVYTQIVKRLFPDVPVVLGGIEASMRRLMHYDYWQERFRPSILVDSGADCIIYGMGEQPTLELTHRVLDLLDSRHPDLAYDDEGNALLTSAAFRQLIAGNVSTSSLSSSSSSSFSSSSSSSSPSSSFSSSSSHPSLVPGGFPAGPFSPIPQTVTLHSSAASIPGGIRPDDIVLHSFEECLLNLRLHAEDFHLIEEQSNRYEAQRLIQQTGSQWVVVNPPYPPITTEEIDHSFDLPYTRLPHPKYKDKRIPAYEMIRFSVNMHRGCFGGCAFCTISAHQGKFVVCRSKKSILREVEAITHLPDFRGYLSDLGGPSANMYGMKGRNQKACRKCHRPSCIHPEVCPNLCGDHRPLLDIYHAVAQVPGIKRAFIGSGVRYDLLLHDWKDEALNKAAADYTRELILHHVSGRLKVAPEHTSDTVLSLMRKPSFRLFHAFKRRFDDINRQAGLRQQIIPYFISSHPGCREEDMVQLAIETRRLDFQLEQVQDFTPTPMTTATTMWATGYDPDTLQPVFCARTPAEKQTQRMFFFWYRPEERRRIEQELRRIGRPDLLKQLFDNETYKAHDPHKAHETHKTHKTHKTHDSHESYSSLKNKNHKPHKKK